MDSKAKLDEVVAKLKEKGIGIQEVNQEESMIMVGGLEGDDEFQGVVVEVDEEGFFLVGLVIRFLHPTRDEKDALKVLLAGYEELLDEDHQLEEFNFDEENQEWGGLVGSVYEEIDEVVVRVIEALDHGVWLDCSDIDPKDIEIEERDVEEGEGGCCCCHSSCEEDGEKKK